MTTQTETLPERNPTIDNATALLSLEKITREQADALTPPEARRFEKLASRILNRSTGVERDQFLEKIDLTITAEARSNLWERNQIIIRQEIAKHIREYGNIPTKYKLAEATGLSRQTVAKHLKENQLHPEFKTELEQFKLLSHTLLANVFKYATAGDMRAAKLYFEMIGALKKQPNGTVVNEHNNYIQINNTILSQENLKQLTTEQLDQIESIVVNKEHKFGIRTGSLASTE